MREETIIEAINDIDSIRCAVEDMHAEITNTPDYWEKLLHQYAGMAMQGILSNHNLYGSVIQVTQVSRVAIDYAQELVEKMKGERK